MNWKRDLQLADIDPDKPLEVTCRRCGYTRYDYVPALLARADMHARIYLDEVEARLRCTQRGCRGHVRIALVTNSETEGFQGGLA